MNACVIPRTSAIEAAAIWDEAPPIRLEHYLWQDEGYRPDVRIRLAYAPAGLHVVFRTYETNPLARYARPNDPVYKDSCVELFLQPTPETDARYVNFEWNAAGTLYLGLGTGRADSRPLEHDAVADFRARVDTECRDEGDGEERVYWQVAFTVPFEWLQRIFPDFRPIPGWRMRGNLYKCGEETERPHYGVWHPVTSATPDYHRSQDFGEMRLG